MRIDQPEDGDTARSGPDAPEPRVPAASEARQARADTRPDSGDAAAAARTARNLEHRAQVDAVYRAYAIDQGCARVEKIERDTVTPAMLAIAAEDPDRHLAGLDHRLKERYRIEEKVNHDIEKRGVTAAEAFAAMKDAIRYTYVYPDDQYAEGVVTDSERIRSAGFQYVDSRNWWPHDEYKGLNSWWRVPENGQMFEVQFHTQASLDAKEETHPAYERLRTLPVDRMEVSDLRAYQREVTAKIPIPPGAQDISLS